MSWRVFVFLGEISYAAYLIHWPMLGFSYYNLEPRLAQYPFWVVLAGFAASVIAASAATWYLVETPARKFLLGRRPKPSAIPAPHYTVGASTKLTTVRSRRDTVLAADTESRADSR